MTKRFTGNEYGGRKGDVFLPIGMYSDYSYRNTLVISPEFFQSSGRSYVTYSSPVTILPLSAEIDVEDLKEIKSFKLEVKMNK